MDHDTRSTARATGALTPPSVPRAYIMAGQSCCNADKKKPRDYPTRCRDIIITRFRHASRLGSSYTRNGQLLCATLPTIVRDLVCSRVYICTLFGHVSRNIISASRACGRGREKAVQSRPLPGLLSAAIMSEIISKGYDGLLNCLHPLLFAAHGHQHCRLLPGPL